VIEHCLSLTRRGRGQKTAPTGGVLSTRGPSLDQVLWEGSSDPDGACDQALPPAQAPRSRSEDRSYRGSALNPRPESGSGCCRRGLPTPTGPLIKHCLSLRRRGRGRTTAPTRVCS